MVFRAMQQPRFSCALTLTLLVTLACSGKEAADTSHAEEPPDTAASTSDSNGAPLVPNSRGSEPETSTNEVATTGSSPDQATDTDDGAPPQQTAQDNASNELSPDVSSDGSSDPTDAEAPSEAASETSDSPTTADAGVDFSHGTRLVLTREPLDTISLGPMGDYSESESLEGLDKTVIAQIADEPTFARQFEVLFPMPSLFLTQCQFWSGAFEVESVEVEEDLDGSGAHLSVDESDGHYTLTHDGPGNHRLRVTGIFREPLEADAGACGPQSGPIEVPLAFTVELHVQRVVNATGLPPLGCNAEPFVLSGRSYPGTPVRLWNEQGEIMQPVNVYDSYPLEVIIETEKEAQIEQAGSSLRYDGLIVTGEPQKIRLSTSYGPLLTYHVVDLAAIDAWDIEFWARAGQDVLYPNRPLTLDTEPAVAPGKALGAYATMKVGKVPICSPIFTSDFSITRLTPEVCDVALNGDTDPTPGVPGFLATFFDAAGTCELDLSFPAANGGEGLTRHLSTVFVPPADP